MALAINLTATPTESGVRFYLDPNLGGTFAEQLMAEITVVIHSSDPLIADIKQTQSYHVDNTNFPTMSGAEETGLRDLLGEMVTQAITDVSPDLLT